jgi:hypothetical protein
MTGIEPVTPSLPRKYSTPELHRQKWMKKRAEDRARTGHPQLGRLMLYQMSYFRFNIHSLVGREGFEPSNSEEDRFTVCCRWPLGYLPNLTISVCKEQSRRRDSNPRPADYKSAALPAELLRLYPI